VALSDDQKAILRLLSQRGAQGYEDLSALMGISASEVYRRAQQAASELEAEGIPAPSIPEPDGSAPAPAPASPEPKPVAPVEPKPIPKREHHSPREEAHRLKLLEGRGLWSLLAGAAAVVLFVIFILVGGDGTDSGGDSTTASSSDTPSGETVAALEKASESGEKEVTKASLQAVDGSEAVGVAIFGRVKKSLALQVAAEGLEPAEEGEGYTIWLAASPQKMLPLASTEVGEDGRIGAQVTVPVEVLAYLANETFREITITRTDETELKASLAKATKEKDAPEYTGDEVLNGEVTGPIVGAANRGGSEAE
jgi:hypothetical protein